MPSSVAADSDPIRSRDTAKEPQNGFKWPLKWLASEAGYACSRGCASVSMSECTCVCVRVCGYVRLRVCVRVRACARVCLRAARMLRVRARIR